MPFQGELGHSHGAADRLEGNRSFEHATFDPQDFLADNQSAEAQAGRNLWNTEKDQNNLMLVWGCVDARARILPPRRIIDVSSISTAGPREPYQRMLNYPGVAGIIVLNHFDGDTLHEGEEPSGCGGVDEFAQMILSGEQTALSKRDIKRFITREVQDKNVVRNAIKLAAKTAKLTDKPVVAALLDHVYGTMHMLAVYSDRGRTLRSELPIADVMSDTFDPVELFQFGIPVLDKNKLPATFRDFVDEQQTYTKQLLIDYPDFHTRQKKQRPSFVVVTTEKIPTRLRYPTIFREPNTFAQIHLPRDRYDLGIRINDADIDRVVEQLQYPISHAALAHNQPEASFATVQAILIETGDLTESGRIATAMEAENDWLAQWKSLPNHQVFVAQTRAGETSQIFDIA